MGRKRKRGRPKGSKNKPGHKAGRPRKFSSVISRVRSLDESEFRRLRGRPRKINLITKAQADNIGKQAKINAMIRLLKSL